MVWFFSIKLNTCCKYLTWTVLMHKLHLKQLIWLYHWWNVTPDIKHILNMAAVTAVAIWVPWRLMLVDMCLYYPWISMNSIIAQTLVNGNTLTRNTNWAWLRAYLVTQATTWAMAHNVALSYTIKLEQLENTTNNSCLYLLHQLHRISHIVELLQITIDHFYH